MSIAQFNDYTPTLKAANDVFTIMAVDDDPLNMWMLQQFAAEARSPRCVIKEFETLEGVVSAMKDSFPNLVIVDERMHGADAATAALRACGYGGAVVILSGSWRARWRAGIQRSALAFIDRDDLTPTAFMGLIDMALAAETNPKPARLVAMGR